MIKSLASKLSQHNNATIIKFPSRTATSKSKNELSALTRQNQIINKENMFIVLLVIGLKMYINF